MSTVERKVGWLLLIGSALVLGLLLLVESFSLSKVFAALFWLGGAGLSSLVTYDLLHRHDLAIRRRTMLLVAVWIVPCVSWVVFVIYRDFSRPVLPELKT
jgi:hypothetical protein